MCVQTCVRHVTVTCVCVGSGMLEQTGEGWVPNVDLMKESLRLAANVNWEDVDLTHFPGTLSTKYTCTRHPSTCALDTLVHVY